MKNCLIGFFRPSVDEFTEIWNKATFVIDANVLLNLYRYPAKASQELLGALQKLADRLWLPYHAAIEYQRNRLIVIAEQKKKYNEVKELIETTSTNLLSQMGNLQLKKRHSSIDVEDFLKEFNELKITFLENLQKLEESQMNVYDEDHIRNNIDQIFSEKVGTNDFNQETLEKIYKEGEVRYVVGMPPGYLDIKKDKSDFDSFQYAGLVYKKRFGDLILWKQIISHAKAKGIKRLVFLTDDEKED